MILHALYDYYQRKAADPESALAPEGFEVKEIPFHVVLDGDGHFIRFADMREGEGKKKRAKPALVPQGVKRASNVAANLLWDNAEYVLGLDAPDKPGKAAAKHEAFVRRVRDTFGDAPPPAIQAVLAFLESIDIAALSQADNWVEIAEGNAVLSFRLQGDAGLVCERADVRAAMVPTGTAGTADFCLVSGESDETERLHTAIKGVWGAQSSGANIVSFNLPAFASWGKEQGRNAPVGKRAAFAYTTALNHLLSKDSRQRMQVGDASTVFWSDRETGLEASFSDLFSDPPKDDPDRHSRAVESLYRAVQTGSAPADDSGQRFYVLGLAPNAARIAVRFRHVDTVENLSRRILEHFDDTEITHAPYEPRSLPLIRLVAATALLGKYDNIPPNLAGDTLHAALSSGPYPYTLMQAALRRIRAEQGHVSYPRAAVVKAWLNRYTRQSEPQEKEMAVSLDESNTNAGYRLGRLFAVLEKIQEEASPGLNATIRDRFYGAASSTPVTAFPNLMKLKNHHLAKLENRGRAVNLEKTVGGIVDGLNDFPAHLSMADQGRFAIGYYHQRQTFFKPNASAPANQGE